MKMYLGGTPVKTMKVKHFEHNTNDATCEPSAVQTGLTYYANGRKQVGTGKSFEFATYGHYTTNRSKYVPTNINVIQVSSLEYPIKSNIDVTLMRDIDFSNSQNIATVTIDGVEYDLVVSVQSNILKITCDQAIQLQVFYGKDNYI